MFSAETDTDMVVCPYNDAHRMQRKRLQPHLFRCRQNYPDIELQKCPFNTTHLIPEPEFALHVTNCSDRKLITQYKYDAPEPKEEEVVRHAPIECEENWDDTEVEDYNPLKTLEQKKVILRPYDVPMSERKAFIKKERRRLGDGSSSSSEEGDDKDDQANESVQIIIKKEDTVDENDKRNISKSPSRSRSKSKSRSRSRSRSFEPQRYPQHSEYYRRTQGDRQPSSPPFKRRNYSEPFYTRAYNLDNDPYYNSGNQSSVRGEQLNGNYERRQRSHFENELHAYGAYRDFSRKYPGPSPAFGRGAHRGYPYNRRNDPPSRSNYE